MLMVDLGQLQRKGRIRIDETVPASDPILEDVGAVLPAGLHIELEAKPVGRDVLVRGRLEAEARAECRRCLREVRLRVDEEVVWLYRSGVTESEAEAADAYAVAPRAREIDLGPAVREHVILALPQFAECEAACRGLCPDCGANLNEGPCDCRDTSRDPRWAALQQPQE
jgi:uncharacterized protein